MKTILFVCTANTCRSPMAACMLRKLAQDAGAEDVRALCAGVYAQEGEPASEDAKRAMARRGLSLEGYRAQQVTQSLLAKTTLVVGMSENHLRALRGMFPGTPVPMRAFDDPPITDPFGGGDAAYERAAQDMERQLPALLDAVRAMKE